MKSTSSQELEMQNAYGSEANFGMSNVVSTLDINDINVPSSGSTHCAAQSASSKAKRRSTGFGTSTKQRFLSDAEEGRGRATPFTNNPSLARQDANAGDTDMEEDRQASSDMCVINFYNLVFFGSGTRLWIPIVWVVIATIAALYQHIYWRSFCQPDLPAIICTVRPPYMYFVLLFEISLAGMIASLYFGWGMVRSNYIENLIRENCFTAEARHESRRMLSRISAGTMIAVTLVYVVELVEMSKLFVSEQAHSIASFLLKVPRVVPIISDIFLISSNFMFGCVTVYIVSIWMWTCWVKLQVNKSLVESVSLKSISDGSFIDAFLDVYVSNSATSGLWKINHIARVFTIVPYAWLGMSQSYYLLNVDREEFKSVAIVNLCFGYMLYGVVWLSIMGAGFVNDNGYFCCARAISALKYQDNEGMSAADNLTHRRYLEGHRMNALLRMDVLRETSGFTFAGAVVSVQKSFAVGSVLVTIMNYKA